MNILLCIVVAHVMVQYLQKKKKLPGVIAVLSICSGIAALSELKFFFVEAGVILALCVLFCKSSFRKAMLSSVGIVALVLGIQVMLIIFPSWQNFFTLEGFLGNASLSYGAGKDSLSRTTAMPVLAQQFFVYASQWLFGIGMGNAEISTAVPAFMSDLGARYDSVLHYSWFSYAMLYLESGALGLGAYVAFFASCGKRAYDVLRSRSMSQQVIVSLIIAFLCPLLIVYNSALRSESGYFIFFMLAVPYIGRNSYTPNRMRAATA